MSAFAPLRRVKNLLQRLSGGEYRYIAQELRRRLWSCSLSLGLERDLTQPFPHPEAEIPLSVRPIRSGEFEIMTRGREADEVDDDVVRDREIMLSVPTCYVAVTPEDTPCYMQWMFRHDQNAELIARFGGAYPELKKGEVLIESAFTRPSFRRKGIMPSAMALIAEQAERSGAERALTFVGMGNIPSLKGTRRAGFTPCQIRLDRWRFFQRVTTFEPVSEEILQRFYELTKPSMVPVTRD